MVNKLYRCEHCFAWYEYKTRAKSCCSGIITSFDVILKKRTSCTKGMKHLYTNKVTHKRQDYCYYCGKKREN